MTHATLGSWFVAALFLVVPALAIAGGLDDEREGGGAAARAGALGVGFALAPGIVAVVVAALRFAGAALGAAAWIAVVATVGLGVGLRALSRPAADAPGPGAGSARATWAWALGIGAVCAAFPLGSEWWRISSDAWTHEGIARAIVLHGLPPADPWYAGFALHYAWLYHVDVAALLTASGIDPFTLMAALAVASAIALVLCAGDAVRRLHGRSVGATLCLLVLGLNALFPAFLPLELARAMFGRVRGLSEVAHVFRMSPFGWDTVGAFLRSLGGSDFFLDKFLVATPLSLALAAFTAWLLSLARVLARGSATRADLALTFLAAGVASLLHPVVAITVAALAGVAGVVALVGRAGHSRPVVAWALASGAGFAPAAWFIARFVVTHGGAQGGSHFDLGLLKIVGFVSCTALGWVALALGERAGRDAGRPARDPAWLAVLATVTALALVIRLPGPSSFFTLDKFSYLVWIPLALTAGPGLAAWLARRRPALRIALVLAVLVPVNGLALLSRAVDPRVAVRQPWDRPAFRWMREHLPPDAVLVVPPGDIDLAVFAQRRQWYGLDVDAELRGLPDVTMQSRREILHRLYDVGSLSDGDVGPVQLSHPRGEPVVGVGPLYLVRTNYRAAFWRNTPGSWSSPAPPLAPVHPSWVPVYADSDVAVYPLPPVLSF